VPLVVTPVKEQLPVLVSDLQVDGGFDLRGAYIGKLFEIAR
jgi:hypothetical protein